MLQVYKQIEFSYTASGNAKWYNHFSKEFCSLLTDKEIKTHKFELAREHIANSDSDLMQDTIPFPVYHTVFLLKGKETNRNAHTIYIEF